MPGMRLLSCLVAIGVVAAAVSPDALAREAGRQTVIVGIVLGGHAPARARPVRAIVEEADRIWRPRGVSIVGVDTSKVGHQDVRITLTFGSLAAAVHPSAGRRGGGTSGLGSIWFDEEGAPGDSVVVDEDAVAARLAGVKLNNRPLADWPPSVFDQMMTRALGRVLAHEIGHYLLRSKAHQASGLMRAAFSGDDLAAWARTRFVLDSGTLPRLRANLARIQLLNDPPLVANGQRAASLPSPANAKP